jgi:hypothetical protein
MPHRGCTLALAAAALVFAAAAPSAAEPVFTSADDGRTFLYRARPGDNPGTVVEMFGLPPSGLAAFLAENGIRDATRVGAGFVYRVPNVPARALAERVSALERDGAGAAAAAAEADTRARELAAESDRLRAAAATAETRATRAARLTTMWPLVQLALVLLAVLGAGALAVARAAFRAQQKAERYARALTNELDEKRKTVLADRQESSRRILELDARVRALETQLGPRVVLGGRGS